MDMIKQQNSQLSDIDDLNYRPPRGQKLLLIKLRPSSKTAGKMFKTNYLHHGV